MNMDNKYTNFEIKFEVVHYSKINYRCDCIVFYDLGHGQLQDIHRIIICRCEGEEGTEPCPVLSR